MSPLDWDLGHIAAYEDLWIAHRHGGRELLRGDLAEVYDAFETPRAVRGDIPFLRGEDVFDYLAAVRERTLRGARHAPARATARCSSSSSATRPSTTRRCARRCFSPGCRAAGRAARRAATPARAEGWIRRPRRPDRDGRDRARLRLRQRAPAPPGRRAGVRDRPAAGDERHAGRTSARAAATSGASGGPTRAGRGRRSTTSPTPRAGRRTGRAMTTDPFSTSPGSRPTPSPVRKAPAFPPKPSGRRRRPGPRSRSHRSARRGSGPPRCFAGYPGFVAHPYREYSEVFFGDRYRVLRGSSWATEERVRSLTFRNWDLPQRRQIFAGVRLAKDVT